MKSFKDKVAVVTGAASGIGKELAIQLSAHGARVALADVNAPDLDAIVNEIVRTGGQASAHRVDVSDREAMNAFAEDVIQQYESVDILINNAGIALQDVKLQNISYEDLELVINVNFWGIVHGTKAFLPHLLKRPHANLVNVSSAYGLAAAAHQGAYSTSKFAVRGFSEALRQELRNTPVKVTVVFPGGVRTAMVRNSRAAQNGEPIADIESAVRSFEARQRISSAEAASQILQGIQRDAPRLLIGNDVKLLDLLARLMPAAYDLFMLKYVVRDYSG